ncbi:putative inorganic phosphate cotransporter [Homalodisca vitripennis]|uniref:putative inorganic phosphate cotransporter n=1 Tax=Homalodisca vitripennis TaxID=197043 RepID=UPI001EEABEFD|nr:putative inorganic phosphate cotransporter [Homalodisca vitripennis]KAG8330871.1 hypothetical protein J6590_053326 [Homalodisca vitripennis]
MRRRSLTPSTVQRLSICMDTKKPTGLGKRHIQAAMAFMCFALAYSMRVNLSVAIVAMTEPLDKDLMVLDWDSSEQGLILSSFNCGYIILNIPGGHLSRVLGPKYLMFGAIMVSSVMTLLVPYIALNFNWIVFCSSRVLIGLSQGFIYPSINTLMSKWAPPEERSKLVSFVYIGSQFGTMVTLFAAGYLAASSWGWPSVFYITGLCGLLWSAIWLYVGVNTPDCHPSISDNERDYIKASLPNSSDISSLMPTPWKQILTSKPVWALAFTHLCQNWGNSVLFNMLPNFINHILGFGIGNDGLIVSLMYLLMCILAGIFSLMTDYCNKRKLLPLTFVRKAWNTLAHWGTALFMVLLTFTASSNVATIALLTIITSLNAATYLGFLSNHIDLSPNFAGLLMGITNGLSNISSFSGPVVTGFIVNDETNRGEWMIAFYISAATYFLGNSVFLLFGSAEIQSWNDPIVQEEKSTKVTRYSEHVTSTT